MHIEQLEIDSFGGLQQVRLEDLGQGIEVIHGTNEIGKTSLLEFIRAVFFGFEGLFRRGVLDPKVPCSGRLTVVTGKGPRGKRERQRFLIERRHEGPDIATLTRKSYEDNIVGLGGDEGDTISVQQLDGTRKDTQRIYLQDIVGDIDESTFTNVMAFGLDELHELRTLEPEGCGSRLYELANGLDRSRVSRTIHQIEEALQRLEQGDGEQTPRQQLLAKQDSLRKDEHEAQSEYYVGDLFIEHAQITREISSLEKAVNKASVAENLARDALPTSRLLHDWQELSDELESLRKVSLVHPDFDGWQQDVKKRRHAFRVVQKRLKERRRLARELATRGTKTAIWKKRVEIKGLLEDRSHIERLVADVTRTEAHAKLAARRFGEQIGLCGLTKVISV
ncbi:MAG: AAA family ATPase, partial [Pirellulales bacterium]|nr:AAA family ATPase [Pirellulales bacterium]